MDEKQNLEGTTDHDEEDVPRVIATHVGDGPGDIDPAGLPESDFDGFPESDVLTDESETEEETK